MRKRYGIMCIVLLALALRLYRITDYTEFLGDQGSAGIVIYESFRDKTLPLVGPVISTGQRPGPFFYYLSAIPLILSGFNPVAPAVLMAVLGAAATYLVYVLGAQFFPRIVGMGLALLYAISPAIVAEDRTFWNPTPVPILTLLLILAVYKILSEKRYPYFLLMGTAVGASVQLHYSAVYHILPCFIVAAYALRSAHQTRRVKIVLVWILFGFLGFLAILYPFIHYEVRNNFTDLKELLVVILYPDSSLSGLPMPIWQIWADSIVRLFGRVTSLPSVLTGSIAALSFAHVIIYRRKWQVLMGLWFLGGIFFVSFYKGALFDHYLYFLLPFPFFLFGGILAQFGKKTHRNLLYGVIVIISLFHIRSTDIGRNGYGDVRRTHATTREIVRQAGSKRFAFGLISSRSYSDLHYRYYFLLQKAVPEYVTERSFEILFLVCETEICPEPQDITGNRKVTMICYDFYCSGDYPSLDVTQWEFVRFADVRGAKIYTYLRTDKENSVTR